MVRHIFLWNVKPNAGEDEIVPLIADRAVCDFEF
jgi:hypothetical protein